MKPTTTNTAEALDALATSLGALLRRRGGRLRGRLGWVGMLLANERAYVLANLPTDRPQFVRMFGEHAESLRGRGFRIAFENHDEIGPVVEITLSKGN